MSLTNPGHTHICRFCNLCAETFYLFITECPSLLSRRAEIFRHYEGPGQDWLVEDIVSFAELEEISEALDFYGMPESNSDHSLHEFGAWNPRSEDDDTAGGDVTVEV